jgi:NADPH:quinone reductase-like Zn-dependent oxidoreductase
MYAMASSSCSSNAPLVRVELPAATPRAREVRVAVHAVGVNPIDWKLRALAPAIRWLNALLGPRGPVVGGIDFAGVVEAVGSKVRGISVGDRVVGAAKFLLGRGSHADTVVVGEHQVCAIPDAIPFDVAGALPVAGDTAWRAVHHYRSIGPTSRVLVLGASGGVGHYAVQIAKHVRLAQLVVGVCSSKNAPLVTGLGADVVLAYDTEDPLAAAVQYGPFDLIVDAVGAYPGSRCHALLARDGRRVIAAYDSPRVLLHALVRPFRSRIIRSAPNGARLRGLVDAVAAGQVKVHIAERFPLADVERAHQLSQTSRSVGKLVLLPRS